MKMNAIITITALYILGFSIASAMDTSTVSTTQTSTFTTTTSFLIEKKKLSYTAIVIIMVLSIVFTVCLASACSLKESGFDCFGCFRCKKTYDIEQGDPVAEAERERIAKAISDEAIRVRIEANRLEDARNDKLAADSLHNFFRPYYR